MKGLLLNFLLQSGHGTHVAGIIGGHTFGVAKKTHLYVAKMMNKAGVGNLSTILAGIDAVANDVDTRDCPKGTVGKYMVLKANTTQVDHCSTPGYISGYAVVAVLTYLL